MSKNENLVKKTELVRRLNKKLKQEDVVSNIEETKIIYDKFFETIRELLLEGKCVKLPEIGLLRVSYAKKRKINSFGKEITVEPRLRLSFKGSPKMKKDLKEINKGGR